MPTTYKTFKAALQSFFRSHAVMQLVSRLPLAQWPAQPLASCQPANLQLASRSPAALQTLRSALSPNARLFVQQALYPGYTHASECGLLLCASQLPLSHFDQIFCGAALLYLQIKEATRRGLVAYFSMLTLDALSSDVTSLFLKECPAPALLSAGCVCRAWRALLPQLLDARRERGTLHLMAPGLPLMTLTGVSPTMLVGELRESLRLLRMPVLHAPGCDVPLPDGATLASVGLDSGLADARNPPFWSVSIA